MAAATLSGAVPKDPESAACADELVARLGPAGAPRAPAILIDSVGSACEGGRVVAEDKPKAPADKAKSAAYDSWKANTPGGPGGTRDKTSLKGKLSAMVDRFIRKFNTDKGWYDE